MNEIVKPVVENSADAVLEEIWRAKDTLSESYGHDVRKLFSRARDQQQKSSRRIVNLQTVR
jgi:hypothetical protein